ncbi:phage tail tape measure protein [Streptomyces acidiscabies]|uniref:Phage tail tape measure protein domain-containing protein n=1 Tax=Streptomyces acidiscabies TaxID=42234 RepID=A0ABU4LM24_9ACTN|nr:hypothetical protein [Streptomyces acidiscabies]MDX3016729.1 hypothetical protein [Streptomyces acidiscabies]
MGDTSLVFNLVARDRTAQGLSSARERFDAAATGIGAGAGLALGASLMQSISIDQANSKLAAQLGLTQAESERIGKVAGGLYADAYGDSMEQVNTAVGSVMSSIKGMSNASSTDLEGVTQKALNFASTFDIEVDRAVQSVGTLINSGLATNATQAFDLITAASQKVPASLREDVLDASDEYSQFFRTLGYGGEEAFAVLVEASAKGTFGIDKAGDAIKEFTLLSTDMSANSQAAYKTIGLDAHTMANAILAGGTSAQGATQKIIDGLLGIKDPATQANTAIALFGTPLEDMNVQDIPAFLQSLKGAGGGMDDFAGASKRSGDALRDNAGTALEEFKRKAMGQLTEVTGAFVAFAMDNKAVVEPLAYVLAGLAVTVLVVKGAMIAYSAIASVVSGAHALMTSSTWGVVGGWIRMNAVGLGVYARIAAGAVVSGVTTAAAWTGSALVSIGTWALAVLRAGATAAVQFALMAARAIAWATVMAAQWLIAMGPIGWIILGVAALVAGIVVYWDQIKSFTLAAWTWIVGKLVWAKDMMISAFLNFTLIGLLIQHWSSIKNTAVSWWNATVAWVKGVPGRIYSLWLNWSLPGLIVKHWSSIKTGTVNKATEMLNWVRGIPGRITSALGGLGGLLKNSGMSLIQGFINGILSKISSVKNAASRVVSAARDFFPFSPAKEGPFAGRGYTLYSGRALIDGFRAGIDDGLPALHAQLDQIGGTNGLAAQAVQAAPLTAGMAPVLGAGAAGGVVRVLFDFKGAEGDFTRMIRKTVRVDGRGNVQTAFGR